MNAQKSSRAPVAAGGLNDGLGNTVWALLVLLAAPLIGSGASALVWIASVGGVFRLLRLPAGVRIPREIIYCAIAFASLFLAEAISGALHWRGAVTVAELSENLVFFGLLPLYVLFERDRNLLLAELRNAAPHFGLLALVIAVVQQYFGVRPEGGAGNAGVFAIVCSLVFVFCSLQLIARGDDDRSGSVSRDLAGFVASAAAVLMSGSRALWPVLIAVPILIAVTGRSISRRLIFGVSVALLFVVGAAALGPPGQRVLEGMQDLRLIQTGDYSTSFGKRLVVWQVGMEAVREAPWFGQGPDAPRRLMLERTAEVGGQRLGYNHFHNFVLNEWVRAGIPGLLAVAAMFLAPLLLTWRNRHRDATALAAFQLVASAQIVFVATGLFNILFDHDIVDALFVAVHALALYLSFGGTIRKPVLPTYAA